MYWILCLVGVVLSVPGVILTNADPFSGDYSDQYGCEADEFTCDNGECVSLDSVCNIGIDCEDGTDEENCFQETNPTDDSLNNIIQEGSCRPFEFSCHSGECIPSQWVCDFDEDCADGSDEPDRCPGHNNVDITFDPVSYSCAADEFTCYSGQCILSLWVCDHYDDCVDGSDELVCFITPTENIIDYPFTPGGDYCFPNPCGQGTLPPDPEYCYPNPCGENGTCTTTFLTKKFTHDGFKCYCNTGHTGKYCEKDLCGPLNCQNNGKCEISWWTKKASCDCLKGYSGKRCEKDLCGPLNCQNNGQCEISWYTHEASCDCPKGYSGKRCEKDLCAELNCQNNAECKISLINSAYCACPEGHSGKLCEKDLCGPLNCQNNGKCEIPWYTDKASCDCPKGYSGKRCEKDRCAELNCQNNAECKIVPFINVAYCDCPEGYKGKLCEKECVKSWFGCKAVDD